MPEVLASAAAFVAIILASFLIRLVDPLRRVELFLTLRKYLVNRTCSWPTSKAAAYSGQAQLHPLSFYPLLP